jgi:hypothetical protein
MTMDIVQTTLGAGAAAGFVGTDPAGEVAALAIENGEAERTTGHQERDAEEAAEAQANAAEVQAMHDEASSFRAQGYFDAATSVAGAVIGVACPAPVAGEKASMQSLIAGHAADGAEKLGDGFWKAAQHDDEASAAADKASSAQHADAAKDASDAAADASATISTALEFDRNALSIESQTQLAALHRA